MNVEDRIGNQDAAAGALFAAARSYHPSARARRRTLRALALPIGLSLLGSSTVGQAAYLLSSVKAWVMVASIVATVGAAGGVAYVVTTPVRDKLAAGQRLSRRESVPKRFALATTRTVNTAGAQVTIVPEQPPTEVHPVPNIAVASAISASVDRSPPPMRPLRVTTRTQPRAPASSASAGPSPVVPSVPHEVSSAVSSLNAATEQRASGGLLPMASSVPARPLVSQSLKAELALVSDAQARLRADDLPRVFATLARYERLFPAGALAEEVELLHMRALIAGGDPLRARSLADTFLHRHPASPLAARVRALIDSRNPPRQGESR